MDKHALVCIYFFIVYFFLVIFIYISFVLFRAEGQSLTLLNKPLKCIFLDKALLMFHQLSQSHDGD